jgi:HSP20 family protein
MTTVDTRQVDAVPTQFNWLDRMFDEWIKAFPAARNFGLHWPFQLDDVIRVDEFQDDKTQVIRAELPGIDPDKDLEITVANGLLHINAERTVEHETTGQGFTRHELRCGSLTRTLPLPGGATESEITATYQDGILEIRIPVAAPAATREPTKIAVSKS